ncbi:TetR/AcrR family transcriptional regulator [Actinomycetospora straminea]|uniref:HTH tetR-type domain-containing protein n=1 Tax=Actinomycetospora straminea TaxID=663607 RepID=A0ABP9EPV9_9PSEU|nr:TetR/AcrR family transcriptional regulator [Actinomycetospora straminea]MDD7933345.1 TetR/AcrR family transcriptional regulator [Actinomycetospora straminea]
MDDGLLVRVGPGPAPRSDEAAGKRAVIVRAATELFLAHGYTATRTEQIAAAAAVSKQTVYSHFGDKERLFREIVLGVTATAEAFADGLAGTLADVTRPGDVEPALRDLARRYLAAVMSPQVLALRRLVIAEATRFPDLAATYWQRAPGRVLAALAEAFGGLADLLAIPDPARAADDFAFLVLGRPLDHGMFHTEAAEPATTDLAAAADHAVDVFLAAYPLRADSTNAQ